MEKLDITQKYNNIQDLLKDKVVLWSEYEHFITFPESQIGKGHSYLFQTYDVQQAKDTIASFIRTMDSKNQYGDTNFGFYRRSDMQIIGEKNDIPDDCECIYIYADTDLLPGILEKFYDRKEYMMRSDQIRIITSTFDKNKQIANRDRAQDPSFLDVRTLTKYFDTLKGVELDDFTEFADKVVKYQKTCNSSESDYVLDDSYPTMLSKFSNINVDEETIDNAVKISTKIYNRVRKKNNKMVTLTSKFVPSDDESEENVPQTTRSSRRRRRSNKNSNEDISIIDETMLNENVEL